MKTLDLPSQITIDVKTWYAYGNPYNPKAAADSAPSGRYSASLWKPCSGMCCLGFCAHQAGVPKVTLRNQGVPEDLDGFAIPQLEELCAGAEYGEELSACAIWVNDEDLDTDGSTTNPSTIEEKMGLLITLFSDHGVDLVFDFSNA